MRGRAGVRIRRATFVTMLVGLGLLTACGAVQGVLPGAGDPTSLPAETLPPPLPTQAPATPTTAFGAEAPVVTPTVDEFSQPTPTRLAPLQSTPAATEEVEVIEVTPLGGDPTSEATETVEETLEATETSEAPATETPTPIVTLEPPSGPVNYTVKAGDTLGEIAKAFDTTVESIVNANSGTYPSLASNPNQIDVGWVLVLPDVVGSAVYTVQVADTLDEIATENGTTIEVLVSLNEDTYPSLRTEPGKLEIGWVLRLP